MDNFSKLNVLVVEDHAFQRNFLLRMLRGLEIGSIQEAEDGVEALRRLRQCMPDVVFLDLQMPGMDGVEFISHLGELNFPGSLVLTSGLDPDLIGTVERLSVARGICVLGKLEKPLDPTQIRTLLMHHAEAVTRPAPTCMVEEIPDTDRLRQALTERQFVPWFQPKVAFDSGELVGVEALARWQHPEYGTIGPAAFIPVMEENGMIGTLTEIVCQAAVKQCRDWLDAGREIDVSLNLSSRSLSGKNVFDWLVAMTRSYQVPPERIILEVTESAIAGDPDQAIANLVRFRMQGFRLSIDDFGTGYSSLEQLNRIPFTELKIDRQFIDGVHCSKRLQAIVESSLHLAGRLQIRTTAEGVETAADWHFLKSKGCDICQGYFAGRPMPGHKLLDWESLWLGTIPASSGERVPARSGRVGVV